MIRVDHAGERGADTIYNGQWDVLKDTESGDLIKHMWEQEKIHLATFEQLLTMYRVRPTVFLPLWDILGYSLGYATATMGKESAMACTVAVEESITEHYNDQIRELLIRDPEERDNFFERMTSSATCEQIYSTLKIDMDTAEKSKQWPFSCYVVAKEMKGSYSGFVDVSATELRLNYLLNKNNVQVHAESVKELNNHVNCIRNKMKNPQVDGQKIYQEYLEGGHPNPSSLEDLSFLTNPGQQFKSKLLASSGGGGSSSNSLFGSSQPTFGSSFGAMGSSSTNQNNANPFSSPSSGGGAFGSNANKPNPFGSSSTPSGGGAFGSSAFSNPSTSSPFGSTNQNSGSSGFGSSAFGSTASTNQNPFGSSAFGGSSQSSGGFGAANQNTGQNSSGFGGSAFGSKASIFGSTQQQQQQQQQQSSPAPAGNAFGSSSQNPFASTTPATSSNSVFGSSNTSNAFQQQAAVTTTASSSPFGSTPTAPKVNPFGSSSTDQTGLGSA